MQATRSILRIREAERTLGSGHPGMALNQMPYGRATHILTHDKMRAMARHRGRHLVTLLQGWWMRCRDSSRQRCGRQPTLGWSDVVERLKLGVHMKDDKVESATTPVSRGECLRLKAWWMTRAVARVLKTPEERVVLWNKQPPMQGSLLGDLETTLASQVNAIMKNAPAATRDELTAWTKATRVAWAGRRGPNIFRCSQSPHVKIEHRMEKDWSMIATQEMGAGDIIDEMTLEDVDFNTNWAFGRYSWGAYGPRRGLDSKIHCIHANGESQRSGKRCRRVRERVAKTRTDRGAHKARDRSARGSRRHSTGKPGESCHGMRRLTARQTGNLMRQYGCTTRSIRTRSHC